MKKAAPLYKVLSAETKKRKGELPYLFAGNMLRFEEDLMHVMIEFGRKIYQECLKEIEESIRQSEFRKKNFGGRGLEKSKLAWDHGKD